MDSKPAAATKPGARARQAQRHDAGEGYLKELNKERAARAEKTARLRALRLAKEAADRATAEAASPVAKKLSRAKTAALAKPRAARRSP